MKRTAVAVLAGLFATAVHTAPQGYFDLRQGVALETGDTWIADGRTYRLYGVQSCLRGTSYTDKGGVARDCGEASLAVLAAFIRDTAPVCAPVAEAGQLTYVACYGSVVGNRMDLAVLLIASGFAFAALDTSGLPVHPEYAVIEQDARARHAGLWQFDDVQHPAILLSKNAHARKPGAGQ
ncbi:MAG: thermonuclease family protein [Mesorhizobium sp.]|uniref:thermonuclease family protein n=1 Tax=Mesorhizobium sp. TaxID=1871066 RepID=UPI000FE7FE43|nr:thermonuclease family protein [Mesorhizobium sp.]RWM06659.1 MAG: thermonuclease family protein [Mesorhizobium sp.]